MSRFRTSPALVVSTLALIVALGGTSYAAFSLPKNSVGTKQIKNRAVTLTKIAPAAQQTLRGAAGPRGLQGPKGDTGSPGPRGPSNGFTQPGANDQPVNTTGTTTVDSLTVPAGSFVVVAKAQPFILSGTDEAVCNLDAPNGIQIDRSYANLDAGTVPAATLTMTGPVTTQGGAVTVRCFTISTNNNVTMNFPRISAVQVDTLTGT